MRPRRYDMTHETLPCWRLMLARASACFDHQPGNVPFLVGDFVLTDFPQGLNVSTRELPSVALDLLPVFLVTVHDLDDERVLVRGGHCALEREHLALKDCPR